MSFGGMLRQATAVDVLIGPFVDSTDGDAEEIGLTIAQADVRLSTNGQPAAQKNDATTCAHDADGFYNCELDATDTVTVGQLTLYVHVAGALAVRHDYQVIEEAVYDALYAAAAAGYGTAQTGDSFARLGAPAGASLAADIAAIEAQTDDIGIAGAGLTALATAANLATVDTVVDAIKAVTDLLPDAGALSSLSTAAALATVDSVVDAILSLLDDARGEPGQGAPAVNPDLATKIDYLYKWTRNKKDNDGTETKFYADDGSTVDHKQTTSESGGTVTKGEIATGA